MDRCCCSSWATVPIGQGTPKESAEAQSRHPFNVHDLWEMDRVSDPQVSPDGKWVVFGVSSLDEGANRRRSDLWMVGTDGTRTSEGSPPILPVNSIGDGLRTDRRFSSSPRALGVLKCGESA